MVLQYGYKRMAVQDEGRDLKQRLCSYIEKEKGKKVNMADIIQLEGLITTLTVTINGIKDNVTTLKNSKSSLEVLDQDLAEEKSKR